MRRILGVLIGMTILGTLQVSATFAPKDPCEYLLSPPWERPISEKTFEKAKRDLGISRDKIQRIAAVADIATIPDRSMKDESGNVFLKAYDTEMAVTPLDLNKHDVEMEVLRRSSIYENPHEASGIRIFILDRKNPSNYQYKDARLYKDGHEDAILTKWEDIERIVRNLESKYPFDQHFYVLELIHSHPNFDIVTADRVLTSPPSQADIQNAKAIASRLTNIISSVVLPNGYKYSISFFKQPGMDFRSIVRDALPYIRLEKPK